jgi:RNA polymerase sigma-70 factor (ECF subfamily)
MSQSANSHAVPRALSRLLESHGDRLYAALARLTLSKDAGAELFQELFLRLARSHGLASANDPAAYAFRAAINLAMEWRRQRRRDLVPLSEAIEVVSDDPSPLQQAVYGEEHERLLNAASELGESAHRVFVLRFIEQQSYEEIARQMETTPHRARGLAHAALMELRKRLSCQTKTNIGNY